METDVSNQQPTVNRVALPGPMDLLRQTFDFYNKHLTVILTISAVSFVIYLIQVLALSTHNGILYGLVSFLLSIISLIVAIILMVAITETAPDTFNGRTTKALKLFFPYVWISILLGLATLGGFLLFIIPGIYLSIALTFSMFALVVEGQRGIVALIQSWHYVKGNWWGVFGRYLFLGLVFMIGMMILAIVANIAGIDIYVPVEGSESARQLSLPAQIITQIISIFVITPMSIIYSYGLYRSLKAGKTEIVTADSAQVQPKKNTIRIFIILGIIALLLIIALTIAGIVHYLSNVPQ